MPSGADYPGFAVNSVVISRGRDAVRGALALPAAYSMAFLRQGTEDLLLWMLSTKMMPAVGVLIPIYLLFRVRSLLDTRSGLMIMYTLMNLPIAVWMLFTFFKEIPKEILEAARMDGAAAAGNDVICYCRSPCRGLPRPRCCH